MKKELLLEHIFTVVPENLGLAGEASSNIKKVLIKMGMAEEFIRRVCIACYEVEMNMVIYSYGGTIKLKVFPDEVIVIAQDCGPGIADVELALKDGYSTASGFILSQGFGAGRGFSNIKRYSDSFSIDSAIGNGTKLELHFKITDISTNDVSIKHLYTKGEVR
jgi:serine/threonine-protein kinase RsbT